jgi:hypothetical protein
MHSEKLEPEVYASPDERPTQNQSESIQDFYRRGDAADPPIDLSEGNLKALLRRVASPSLNEIDRVIHDLENVREILCNEGERVAREITDYASLSRASMSAMKVISEGTKQWKDAREQT